MLYCHSVKQYCTMILKCVFVVSFREYYFLALLKVFDSIAFIRFLPFTSSCSNFLLFNALMENHAFTSIIKLKRIFNRQKQLIALFNFSECNVCGIFVPFSSAILFLKFWNGKLNTYGNCSEIIELLDEETAKDHVIVDCKCLCCC